MSYLNQALALLGPIFLIAIATEVIIGRRRGLKLYTKDQTILSAVIGFVQRPIRLLPIGLAGTAFSAAIDFRIFEMSLEQWWYIPALFLGVEFFYYWFHRASHEIRWLWANHSVHHSIEEMNILGANRLGWTEWLSNGSLTFLPLVIIGFHPAHIVMMLAINLIYQSWLHTTLIGKLGPIEGILNTPSSHRVHHASNADYLDRNHGGVLMIFDRMFGTYVAERDDEPVKFGLVRPPETKNPVKVAFHEWGNILHDLKSYSVRHWPMLLFGPPGWAPYGQGQTSAVLRAAYLANPPRPDRLPAE